jgi:hypothetical protein
VIFAAVVYFVMPGNPDEVTLPADLMAGFRYLSLIGLTLFWAVLGVTFAALNRKTAESRPATA